MKAYLLGYKYDHFVQGDVHKCSDYVLVYAPENASMNELVRKLIKARYKEWTHEIDEFSVENLTIE